MASDSINALAKLLKPKPKPKTKFVEYGRSSAGSRVYKPRVTPKRRYNKKRTLGSAKDEGKTQQEEEESVCTYSEESGTLSIQCETENVSLVNELPNQTLSSGCNYDEVIKQSVQLLSSFVKTRKKKYSHKGWHERIVVSHEQWTSNRNIIWDTLISEEAICDTCDVCDEKKAVVKCNDCTQKNLCYNCDTIIHLVNPLHDRSCYLERYLEPLTPLDVVNEFHKIVSAVRMPMLYYPKCERCGGTDLLKQPLEDTCVVLTLKGKYI